MAIVFLIIVYLIHCSCHLYTKALDVDPNGYILYCPCMGRFGNQADHFLGALAFAHGLNRTLALPPWVEYRPGYAKSIQVPFDTYFKVHPLQEYHKVLTMEKFMKDIAPSIWPKGQRKVFCYGERGGSGSCNAKDGNPFGPFWDTFGIDFDESVFYQPLHYDIHYHNMAQKWNERFPPNQYPVLAFTGAPAHFPVQEENRALQEYLIWSDNILKKAKTFIRNMNPKGPFVGIHLRNGADWIKACEHVEHSPLLFAAPQCLGYSNENGKATHELCFPTKEIVLKQLRRVVKALRARSVFVASDNNHMIEDIERGLKDLKVASLQKDKKLPIALDQRQATYCIRSFDRFGKFQCIFTNRNPQALKPPSIKKIKAYKLPDSEPHVDLAILGLSNHFIGNCISSFSAFVKRERDVNNLQSSFWAFPLTKTSEKSNYINHDEF